MTETHIINKKGEDVIGHIIYTFIMENNKEYAILAIKNDDEYNIATYNVTKSAENDFNLLKITDKYELASANKISERLIGEYNEY